MAITGWSLTDYLNRLTTTLWNGSDDLFANAWGFRPQDTGQGDLLAIGDATVDDQFRLRVNNANTLSQDVNNGSVVSATTGVEAPNETWFSVQGVKQVSSTTIQVWLDGANNDSSGLASGALDVDEVTVGRSLLGNSFDSAWGLAEVSFWDVNGFTNTQLGNLATQLAGGANPLALNTQGGQPWGGTLMAYWRLQDNADLNDLSGAGEHLSTVGTLSTFGTHPPVDPVPGAGATRTNLSLLGVG